MSSGVGNWTKFQILLWKNYLIMRNHKIQIFLEVMLPPIFSLLLVYLRCLEKPEPQPAEDFTSFDVTNFFIFRLFMEEMGPSRQPIYELAYSPKNPFLDKIVSVAANDLGFDGYRGFHNAKTLERVAMSQNYFAGVQFDDKLARIRQYPKKLSYALRFPSELRIYYGKTWETKFLYPYYEKSGPRESDENFGSYPYYMYEGFLPVQYAISTAYLKLVGNTTSLPVVYMHRFPYPAYYEDNFLKGLASVMGTIWMLSLTYSAISIARYITTEKEKQLKEVMKIMGIQNWIHWSAWFVQSFVILGISWILVLIILKIKWKYNAGVLTFSDWTLLLAFLLVYTAASICFCFMVAVFFSKASTAGAFIGLIWFLTYVPFINLNQVYNKYSVPFQLSWCLLCNTAMPFGLKAILSYEQIGQGIHWGNLFETVKGDNSLTLGAVMVMMLVSTVVYMIICLYVEQIFPGKFGVPKEWYFPLNPRYWFPKKHYFRDDEEISSAPIFRKNAHAHEKEPEGKFVGLEIRNLKKKFHDKWAVKGVSFKMYQDEITVLLGHNGAGKTTTISMLIGMFPPTSGTAIVNGFDIVTDTDEARASMSICPQHNVLFDEISVANHIKLFSRLKGLEDRELKKEVEKYLKVLHLENKAETPASKLSGGMKRKLSVCCAFCGGTEVVLCDEPTSGMDPAARRTLWNLLQGEKNGRTLLLTTHYMDEADILGDRIAIMADGELKCSGTSFFLKKKFGSGYRLVCVKGENCRISEVTKLLHRYIPRIQPESNVGTELTYALPDSMSQYFEKMFGDLERESERLGLDGYGVSITSLEEVFMKFRVEEVRKRKKDQRQSMEIFSEQRSDSKGFVVFLKQWDAMLFKKALFGWHNNLLLAQCVFIVILLLIVIYVGKHNFDPLPALTISLKQYTSPVAVLEVAPQIKDDSLMAKIASGYEDVVYSYGDDYILELTGQLTFRDYILGLSKHIPQWRIDTFYLAAATVRPNQLIVWLNNIPLHTAPMTLNLMHNAMAKAVIGDDAEIDVINFPLPYTPNNTFSQLDNPFNMGTLLADNIVLAMSFVSALYIYFPIKERVSRAKLLQFVAGVKVLTFWCSQYLYDLLCITFIVTVLIITLAIFQLPNFSNFNDLALYYEILVIFGFSALPWSYLISFILNGTVVGFGIMVIFNILSGLVLYKNVLTMMFLDKVAEARRLQHVLRIFPHFSLARCLNNLYINIATRGACDAQEIVELSDSKRCTLRPMCCTKVPYFGWDEPGILQEVLYLLIVGPVLFFIVIMIDFRVFDRIINANWLNSVKPSLPALENDGDDNVMAEKKRIQDMSRDERNEQNLVLDRVSKFYKNFLAVHRVSFCVNPKECFGLLGVNGAGKTTIFKMITGDERITFGSAHIRGINLSTNMNSAYKEIGYCPQFDALVDDFTGRELLRIFSLLRGVPRENIRYASEKLAKLFGFFKYIDKPMKKYSGGNKRKLSTAIAVLGGPSIIYLDEPTAGMDPYARRQFWKVVCLLRDHGKSIVLTSHSMEECEALCTRLAIMVNGEFQCIGSTQQLKNKFSKGLVLKIKVGHPHYVEMSLDELSYQTSNYREESETKYLSTTSNNDLSQKSDDDMPGNSKDTKKSGSQAKRTSSKEDNQDDHESKKASTESFKSFSLMDDEKAEKNVGTPETSPNSQMADEEMLKTTNLDQNVPEDNEKSEITSSTVSLKMDDQEDEKATTTSEIHLEEDVQSEIQQGSRSSERKLSFREETPKAKKDQEPLKETRKSERRSSLWGKVKQMLKDDDTAVRSSVKRRSSIWGRRKSYKQDTDEESEFEYDPNQRAPKSLQEAVQRVKDAMKKQYPLSVLQEEHQGMLTYYIPLVNIKWSKIFGFMEKNLAFLHIEDYSISQTTLEEIFLEFAKHQQSDTREIRGFMSGRDPSKVPPYEIVYSPENPYLDNIVRDAAASLHLDKYMGFDDSKTLQHVLVNKNHLVGVQFDEELSKIKGYPKKLSFALRFPNELRFNFSNVWDTRHLYPMDEVHGPREPNMNKGAYPFYVYEGFTPIQNAISMSFLKLAGNTTTFPDIFMQRFPYPAYLEDPFLIDIPTVIGFVWVISFIYSIVIITRNVIIEKEKQLKEVLKIMGIPNWLHWGAWFVQSFLILSISCVLLVVVVKVKWYNDLAVIPQSNWLLLLVFLLIYIAHSICFCFMVGVFFSKANAAAAMVGLFWLMSFLPNALIPESPFEPNLEENLWLCLLCNSALVSGLTVITNFEKTGDGIHWENIFEPVEGGSRLTLGALMIMMLVSSVVYMIVCLYVEQIFPGKFGVPKKWYFPLNPRYWYPKKSSSIYTETIPGAVSRRNFYVHEKEPEGKLVGLETRNLKKKFHDKWAVKGLSFKMYQDEITVLVGHNGAGKTTTISMLTGMFPPTSGTAIVNGFDIVTDSDEARASMGICPQHNVLFDEISVANHIKLFSRLKGLEGKEVQTEVKKYLNLLHLENRAKTSASKLSGGMKRKLSVCCAFCGNAKVVLCDEPSSGVDPASRRTLWNLLQSEKNGRTLLLTTDYMDEADIVGDRILIMSGGKLKCSGTSFFLRKKYGTGYRLVCVKREHCNVPEVTKLLGKYIPNIQPRNNVGHELTYQLPRVMSNTFAKMFEDLERESERLGIHGFGVNVASLEDVFFKVGDEISESRRSTYSDNYDDIFSKDITRPEGKLRFYRNQWHAMLLKKLLYSKRRKFEFFAKNVFVICTISLAVFAVKDISGHSPPLTFSLTQYQQAIAVLEMAPAVENGSLESRIGEEYRSIVHSYGHNYKLESTEGKNFSDYILGLVKASRQWRIDLTYLAAVTISPNKIVAWINDQPLHTAPMTLNLVHNAIAKAVIGPSAEIEVTNYPLPYSGNPIVSRWDRELDVGERIANSISLCMAFVSALYIFFPIKERTSFAKLLQFVAGVRIGPFWCSQYLWDLLSFTWTALVIVLIMACFQVRHLSSFDDLIRIFAVLFLFGFAIVPCTYYFSYPFRVSAMGFGVAVIMNTLTGTVFFTIYTQLVSLEEISKSNALKWFLRCFPHFALEMGISNLYRNSATRDLCSHVVIRSLPAEDRCEKYPKCCKTTPYFDWQEPGILPEIIYLLATGVLVFMFVVLREHHVLRKLYNKLCKRKTARKKKGYKSPRLKLTYRVDNDVGAEKKRVLEMSKSTIDRQNIVMDRITKNYGYVEAVKRISLCVNEKECFGLLGVNGAGKTTLFKIMTGIEEMSSGYAFVKGLDLSEDMSSIYKEIGYCPQFDALVDDFTAREILKIYALLRGVPKNEIHHTCEALAQALDFITHIDEPTKTYSIGNKRKLSTAIALIGNPSVIYLDEPTTGMDPLARYHLWSVLSRILESGRSILLSTHNMEECEALCTRLAIMVNGEFKCIGSSQYLKNKFSKGLILKIKVKSRSKPLLSDVTERRSWLYWINLREKVEREGKSVDELLDTKASPESESSQSSLKTAVEDGEDVDVDVKVDVDENVDEQHRIKKVEDDSRKSAAKSTRLGSQEFRASIRRVIEAIKKQYPLSTLQENYEGMLTFYVPLVNVKWSTIFGFMEKYRHHLNIEDYSISQTTLEEIFLEFANNQIYQFIDKKSRTCC